MPSPSVEPTPGQSPDPSTTSGPCATSSAEVLAGAANGQASAGPLDLAQGVVGAYATKDGGDNGSALTAALWSQSGARTATQIATVSGPDVDDISVADLSKDGTTVLLSVATVPGRGIPPKTVPQEQSVPACISLYFVRTDGSAADLLVRYVSADGFLDGRVWA